MYRKIASCFLIGYWLSSCDTLDRSLVFATHTTTGFEISAQGASSTPLSLVIGQKRFEGVMNPVYDKGTIDAQGNKYRHEAYSVIAKFEGQIKGSGKAQAADKAGAEVEGAVATSQYFATGEAAINLSKNLATAATLTDNPAVAAELARMSSGLPSASAGKHSAMVSHFRVMRQFLAESTKEARSSEATRLLADLDALHTVVPATYPDNLLAQFVAGTPELHILRTSSIWIKGTNVPKSNNFGDVTSYYDALQKSVIAIDQAVAHAKAQAVQIQLHNTPPGVTDPAPQTVNEDTLISIRAQYVKHRDSVLNQALRSDAVAAALAFMTDSMTAK